MSEIVGVRGREILDSMGNPTVEAEVWLDNGVIERASVPGGVPIGQFDAAGLRDGGARYGGRGVLKAAMNINNLIEPELLGLDPSDQAGIDGIMIELDGTADKSRLGANAILAVSLAVARVAAADHDLPLYAYLGGLGPYLLPTPLINAVKCFQEYMLVPHGASTFAEAIRMGTETFHALGMILGKSGYPMAVGGEGGFAPNFKKNSDAFKFLTDAIAEAGYEPGVQISLAMDASAGKSYRDGKYELAGEGGILSADELVDYYAKICTELPIVAIEDGMSEEDWDGWATLTKRLGGGVQLVGGELFATNPIRLERGVKYGAANAVLVKPNQIGSLSETLKVVSTAKASGYGVVISNGPGETEDTFIADLAVAAASGRIKAGSSAGLCGTAKYNQLLRIEESLGGTAKYAGFSGVRRVKF